VGRNAAQWDGVRMSGKGLGLAVRSEDEWEGMRPSRNGCG
jgi:hypothetical protein